MHFKYFVPKNILSIIRLKKLSPKSHIIDFGFVIFEPFGAIYILLRFNRQKISPSKQLV
jgi:hypothetical protein